MCYLKIVTSTGTILIKIVRISPQACRDNVNTKLNHLIELKRQNVITLQQHVDYVDSLKKWKQDCMHSMVYVRKYNNLTNEIREYYYPITKSENDILIKKSLSEYYLGEKDEFFKVIKINEGLYITSHSLIIDTVNNKLKFDELEYDSSKDIYIYKDPYNNFKPVEFSNLKKENVDKIKDHIKLKHSSLDSDIKKVDITAAGDSMNDVVALKYLQEFKNGTFEKKSYQEIGQEMDLIDLKFSEIEKNFIQKKITAPEPDEL